MERKAFRGRNNRPIRRSGLPHSARRLCAESRAKGHPSFTNARKRSINVLLQQEQRQVIAQRIDPKIILANSILQLSTMELVQSIESELLENPALDTVEDSVCAGDCLDPASCPYCNARKNKERSAEQPLDLIDSGDHEAEYE